MISSLEDAWQWYESVKNLTQAMERMGKKHWNNLPWEDGLGKDEKLNRLNSANLLDWATCIFDDLDDFCVLLLFSVFEATVRDRVLLEIEGELKPFRHVASNDAISSLKEGIRHGSFHNNVLRSYKQIDQDRAKDLVEEVNQVRRYRNWFAHGRRGAQPDSVDPRSAFDRLQRFLRLISAGNK